MTKSSDEVKYKSPKILLLDTSPDIEEALRSKGFDTAAGSFGHVSQGIVEPLLAETNDFIPFDSADRWLTIVQLVRENDDKKGSWKRLPSTLPQTILPNEHKVVDFRPLSMFLQRNVFDRIIRNGGIIICFANPRTTIKLFDGPVERPRNVTRFESWGFSSFLSEELLTVEQTSGHEMRLDDKVKQSPFGRLLQHHLKNACFLCAFRPQRLNIPKIVFTPLIRNKFRIPVGGLLTPTKANKTGHIFILPQLSDKATFLAQLLTDTLPDVAPHLFPELVSGRWLTDPDYEIPEVLQLRNRIDIVRQNAQKLIDTIEAKICQEREQRGFLHDLLKGTGDCLVDAVEKTLKLIGFEHITNVDNEIAAGRETIQRREDLRIEKDGRRELVVEVRGISNLPSDEDCLGAEKHVFPRAKEKQDFDVKGLTIINHERNLPPLARQHNKVFRDEVVTNATQKEIGLLTTWNLYRLVRSYLKYGWKHEQIEHLFYQSGPIIPVPNHYSFLGTIGRLFTREQGTIMGIEVEQGKIVEGDVIAVETANEFEEQEVTSLMIGKQFVSKAVTGDQVGILTPINRERLQKGMKVFKVSPAALVRTEV